LLVLERVMQEPLTTMKQLHSTLLVEH